MSQNAGGFSAFVPGFEFLQTLAQQGQQLGATASGLPQLNHWVAPTFDVEELDKRIQELKAVHFWLDQNSKALAATIQALEVQKMTLATLKTMNVNLGEMAQAMRVDPDAAASAPKTKHQFAGFEVPPKPADEAEPTPAAQPEAAAPDSAEAEAADAASAAPKVDPLQWWGALNQQFQTIASQALQEVVVPGMAVAEQVAKAATAPLKAAAPTARAAKRAADTPAAVKKAPAKASAATKKAAPKKTTARSTARRKP
jgi:hypothetical protein